RPHTRSHGAAEGELPLCRRSLVVGSGGAAAGCLARLLLVPVGGADRIDAPSARVFVYLGSSRARRTHPPAGRADANRIAGARRAHARAGMAKTHERYGERISRRYWPIVWARATASRPVAPCAFISAPSPILRSPGRR